MIKVDPRPNRKGKENRSITMTKGGDFREERNRFAYSWVRSFPYKNWHDYWRGFRLKRVIK